ncbi:serine/threonine-protein kinase [Leucobacter luti]|uniref:non-specific serine/threonine protein kinase n=1 Tax=Leucobacter luti TaxID=340320 RepID=A0A4Q7TKQ5_9MICO|nr:Stk1 family PASTA domain-containing Ser/Thr kinase [Leucobacter luti]MBL3700096.1 Stk1 family PASTA domain-containing Ser/Thr kinase [Leucobacter luti]RZT61184.1 serine/threonine-protein kinase [Leucobacter luti]
MIGHTLDERYAIRSRIARGGMATVYLATDLRLERRVAVKVMHEHLAEDENFTRRFEQEARSAARLAHPNLVNVFDQGHDAGRTYLVMEYLPSITLRDLLKQQKRLTTEQTLEISEAVLSGLAAAHRADIVHRDLKPENVMLADDGRIKLGDFGLARAVSANTTTGQALLGTIAYLSPELVTRGVADARSDVYAFGIMFYEMLTGTQPFTGEQPMQIAYQHAHSEVPLPSLKSDEVTPELDQFVRWTTQREPEDRPRDAEEALGYLTAMQSGQTAPIGATRVLDFGGAAPTPSTTVLDEAQRQALAGGTTVLPASPFDTDSQAVAEPETPATALDRAAAATRRRAKRGRVLALILVVLVVLAGGVGWWFGQGPGSQVTVPDVAGTELADAQAALERQDLLVDIFECSSLTVPVGQAAATEPKSGSRLDRGSTVRLCSSTGPALKDVPTIVGLSLDDAMAAITAAGFTFGEVTDTRFDEAGPETVLAALDPEGEQLGEQYPEQGAINLIVSAGPLPNVAGMTADDATAALTEAGLTVDPELGSEAHSSEVAEGSVLALTTSTDPVRPGDPVGLQVSLGPELFEIPDVSGLGLQEAMDTLTAAGFVPTSLVPEGPLRGLAKATGTDPAVGERVQAGTEIRVKSTIAL